MNKNYLLLLLFLIIGFTSCSTYYLVQTPVSLKYYDNDYKVNWDDNEQYVNFILPNDFFVFNTKSGYNDSHEIIYGNNTGYVSSGNRIKRVRRISKEKYYSTYKSHFSNYYSNSLLYKKRYFKDYSSRAKSADSINNSSYDNNSSYKSTNSGGPVHVRGYYRKDGTYVRPHTRSAPRRRY